MRIPQWKTKLLVAAGYLCTVALFYVYKLPCVFQAAFGIPCPGCGMTRAVLAALRLDLAAAFGYHAMFWSMPVLFLYFLFDQGLFRNKCWDRLVLWGICIGFAANWLIKLL